jgi:cytochrome c-type biogenesis protein CcmH
MIWLLIALISGLAVLALVLPVLRPTSANESQGLGAFAGQLEELKRDADLGLIELDAAAAAEREIQRRAALAKSQAGSDGVASPRLRLTVLAGATLAAMAAVLIYMQIGQPQLVGARPEPVPQASQDMQAVMAEIDALAADLMANPDNPQGWAVLGQAYMTLGRYDEAAIAYENAIDRISDSAFLFASLGQAYLFGANGTMTPPAREAFARALDLEPQDIRARFFMAEALFQEGDRETALAEWQALLESAPEDAGYRPMIEARLAAARETVGD